MLFKLLVLFTFISLSYQHKIVVPPGEYYSEKVSTLDDIEYSVKSLDGSRFSLVVLPVLIDIFPEQPYYNLVTDCDYVLECNGILENYLVNYTFIVINEDLSYDGLFVIDLSLVENEISSAIVSIVILSLFCCFFSLFGIVSIRSYGHIVDLKSVQTV